MTLKEFRENPFAWPGGYALLALMGDGDVLCHPCVKAESEVHEGHDSGDDPWWRFEDGFIHWEGDPIICANCNKPLPSEHGPVEEEEKK